MKMYWRDKIMMKLGFIDYYLDEWHANNYPAWIAEASGGDMRVTHAYALINSPRGGLSTAAWCEKFGVTRCHSIEEIIAKCDGLIVLSPDDPQMHETLCALPLRCGKPVYVDKTFAPDLETAKRIIANAENTPFYTTSALRYAEEYRDIDASGATGLFSWGPGQFEIYAIHQIEPIVMLMGEGARRVMCLPGRGLTTLAVEFASGRCATLACCEAGGDFGMRLFLPEGAREIRVQSDYFRRFIAKLVAFFRDRKPPVSTEETLRVMAIRGAGIKAAGEPLTWISI